MKVKTVCDTEGWGENLGLLPYCFLDALAD